MAWLWLQRQEVAKNEQGCFPACFTGYHEPWLENQQPELRLQHCHRASVWPYTAKPTFIMLYATSFKFAFISILRCDSEVPRGPVAQSRGENTNHNSSPALPCFCPVFMLPCSALSPKLLHKVRTWCCPQLPSCSPKQNLGPSLRGRTRASFFQSKPVLPFWNQDLSASASLGFLTGLRSKRVVERQYWGRDCPMQWNNGSEALICFSAWWSGRFGPDAQSGCLDVKTEPRPNL